MAAVRSSGIHSTVQIRPLTGDADVRLIHPPGAIGAPELAADPLIQNGRETLDPAPDRDMVHREAALRYYFFQISVAERIPQIPADTQYDDSVLEVSSAEERRSFLGQGPTISNRPGLFATEPLFSW